MVQSKYEIWGKLNFESFNFEEVGDKQRYCTFWKFNIK